MKVGTEDGKLRLATRSEARRVQQRFMGGAVSPTGGRSRRVTADPDPDSGSDLAALPDGNTDVDASLPTLGAGSGGAAGPTAPPMGGAGASCVEAEMEVALPCNARCSSTGGGFTAQLNAALQAAQPISVYPLALSESRPALASTEVPALSLFGGLPAADVMPVSCGAMAPPQSTDSYQPAVAVAPTTQLPPASRSTAAKASRSEKRGSCRAAAGKAGAAVLTNRGRVRQRGSKRAELLRVGKLRCALESTAEHDGHVSASLLRDCCKHARTCNMHGGRTSKSSSIVGSEIAEPRLHRHFAHTCAGRSVSGTTPATSFRRASPHGCSSAPASSWAPPVPTSAPSSARAARFGRRRRSWSRLRTALVSRSRRRAAPGAGLRCVCMC